MHDGVVRYPPALARFTPQGLIESGPHWRIGARPEVLALIAQPAVNLAIWSSRLDLALALWIERHLDAWPSVEERLPVVRGGIDPSGCLAHLPDGPMRTHLWEMLTAHSRLLVAALGSQSVDKLKVSLGPVEDDQCRKFHVDRLRLRLLSTFVGPGTEWLEEDNVVRSAVGASSCCPADANRAIVRDAARVRRASAGDVLIMKGGAWPGNEARAIVHRSPPIAGSGTRRLLWVLTAS